MKCECVIKLWLNTWFHHNVSPHVSLIFNHIDVLSYLYSRVIKLHNRYRDVVPAFIFTTYSMSTSELPRILYFLLILDNIDVTIQYSYIPGTLRWCLYNWLICLMLHDREQCNDQCFPIPHFRNFTIQNHVQPTYSHIQ